MSFFEAEEFCQSLHEETGLAEIHHESDQNLITAALKEHNLSQYDWWAGATDEYQVPTYHNGPETQINCNIHNVLSTTCPHFLTYKCPN